MPHPVFRRVVGPDPNNGIRGDKVRPSLFNDIYEALENTPTLDDLQSPVNLQGVLTSTGDLPDDGNTTGDAYLVNGTVWVWSGTAWTNQGSLTTGPQGEPALLNLKGTVDTTGDLPASSNVVNDVWVVEADGHGWAWTTDHEWVDVGTIQGPQGNGVPSGGTAGQEYRRGPVSNTPMWAKRRYIVVDDVIADGGTIQDALNLVPASGADVVFRADGSSYTVPSAGLTVKANTRIVPMGSRAAKLTAPASAAGAGVIIPPNSSGANVHIEGLDIDCNGEATMSTGIYLIANSTSYKDTRINDVIVRNALGSGIWSWKTNGLVIDNVQMLDCVYGLRIEDLNGRVRIIDPRIINTVSGRMQYGILLGGALSLEPVDAAIVNPTISGADYATSNGSAAHGILVTNNPGTRIIGGDISTCGNPANNQGGGIVLGAGSYWSSVDGTILHDNNSPGMWVEFRSGTDFTLGDDRNTNGASISNVHFIENVHGVSCSYGAGTTFTGCHAIGNEEFGFVTDSEGVTFLDCVSANNWSNGSATTIHHGGNKGGFHLIRGGGSYDDTYSGGVIGCHAYDNRTVKLQQYGLCAHLGGYVISGNNFANNATGAIYQGSGGSTKNRVANNGGYVNRNSGVTSVADGGTISHGLATTPTAYSATATTSGEFASVTSTSSTTLTVAIKKHDNSAGTTQNIAWTAEV